MCRVYKCTCERGEGGGTCLCMMSFCAPYKDIVCQGTGGQEKLSSTYALGLLPGREYAYCLIAYSGLGQV